MVALSSSFSSTPYFFPIVQESSHCGRLSPPPLPRLSSLFALLYSIAFIIALDEGEVGFTVCVIAPDDANTDPTTARSGATMEAAVDPKVWVVGVLVHDDPVLPLATVALPPGGVTITC